MEKMIRVSDALEYCRRAAELNKNLMMDALKRTGELDPNHLAWDILAHQFFMQEFSHWDIYVPRMIKSIADGTWEEDFKENQNEGE